MKAPSKKSRGKNFSGAIDYLLDHDEPEIIYGTINTSSRSAMIQEFLSIAELRTDIEKPVWLDSLRLPIGEYLSNEKWQQIAERYMKEMQFSDVTQYVVVKHNNKNGEHIHIIANRITPSGHVYFGKHENLLSTRVCQKLEKEFDLTTTKGPQVDSEMSKLTKSEIEKALRTGKAPERTLLQSAVNQALVGKPTVAEFTERLNVAGIIAVPNIATTGTMNGFSFRFDKSDIAFSGSKLGKAFKWSVLQKELDYNKERDTGFLRNLKHFFSESESKTNEFTVEVVMDDKDRFKRNLTSKLFYEELKFDDMRYVNLSSKVITFNDNSSLSLNDDKSKISASNMSPQKAAERLVEAGVKCGWQSMSFSGSEEFVQLAMINAIERGIDVVAKNEQHEEILQKVKYDQAKTSVANDRAAEFKSDRANQDNSRTRRDDRNDEQSNDSSHRRTASDAERNSSAFKNTEDEHQCTQQIDQNLKQSDRIVEHLSTRKNQESSEHNQNKNDSVSSGNTDTTFQSTNSSLVDLSAHAHKRASESAGLVQQDQQSRSTVDFKASQLAKIKHSVHQIENLAAPVLQQKNNDKTAQAVIEQLNQMRCNMYEVGTYLRDKKLMTNKEMSASEIVKSISKLKRDNARGNDIYIRPGKNEASGLVLVDDIEKHTIEEMIEEGRQPALVVETSHKNYQAWVRIADTASDEIRLEASRLLAKEYGADKGSVDARHYGRLAGFTNQKTEHQNKIGRQPYCLLSREMFKKEDALKVSEKSKQDYKKAKDKVAEYAALKERARRLEQLNEKMMPMLPHELQNLDFDDLYRYKYQQLKKVFGKDFDDSTADFRIAKSLLSDNVSKEDVKRVIKDNSPDLADRKGNQIDDYLERTVSNAKAKNDFERSKKQSNKSTSLTFEM